jgi:hypothetical protein
MFRSSVSRGRKDTLPDGMMAIAPEIAHRDSTFHVWKAGFRALE